MKIIVTGKAGPLQTAMKEGLAASGHEIVLVRNRRTWPEGSFDLCLDTGAGGMKDVRRVMIGLAGKVNHYVQLSSYEVYPDISKPTPWRPEDIDLYDESGVEPLDIKIRGKRAAERELRILGNNGLPWTVIRPGMVEIKESPDPLHMWWLVSRILDGGPVLLPDSDDPLFRHVSGSDLVRAILAVACREESFSQVLNVVSSAVLSYESYALLLMKVLGKKVEILRVPRYRWDAAGLALPMGGKLTNALLESSQLLKKLGWQPDDEEVWVREYAQHLADNPLKLFKERRAEIDLSKEPVSFIESRNRAEEDSWRLMGRPGVPNSFRVEYGNESLENGLPVLKTLRFAMSDADQEILIDGSGNGTSRVLGQNVLLEMVDPGSAKLVPGKLFVPVGQFPCGVPDCAWCASHDAGVAGVDHDGYAKKLVNVQPEHLISIPDAVERYSLLVHPLSILLSTVPYMLEQTEGAVWVFGGGVDAVMTGYLVEEALRPLVHVDRVAGERGSLPDDVPFMSLEQAHKRIRSKKIQSPSLIVNVSGAKDGENLLAGGLARGGILASPFLATGVHSRRLNVNLPKSAPGRIWLEKAVKKLEHWVDKRDLKGLVRFVSSNDIWEVFLHNGFQQTGVDMSGEAL